MPGLFEDHEGVLGEMSPLGSGLWPLKNWEYSDVIRWDSLGLIRPFSVLFLKKNQSRLSHNRFEYLFKKKI